MISKLQSLKTQNYMRDKKFSCKHSDCKYQGLKSVTGYYANGKCNFMAITGHSRIAQLPEGEARKPINCPFYEPKHKKRKTEGDDEDMKWISVEDELPEPGKQVLGIGQKGGYCIMRKAHNEPYFINVSNNRQLYPTHWMELPERPEGE